VYVDIAGKMRHSAADAALLAGICDRTIEWAKTTARYQSEEQRREVIALYEKARAVYALQMKDGE
jgi:hypothetical protein